MAGSADFFADDERYRVLRFHRRVPFSILVPEVRIWTLPEGKGAERYPAICSHFAAANHRPRTGRERTFRFFQQSPMVSNSAEDRTVAADGRQPVAALVHPDDRCLLSARAASAMDRP